MKLLVQSFLETHTIQELEEQHGVEITPCDHKFSLNYNQIASREGDVLAQQCRGLILASSDGSSIPTEYMGWVPGKTTILAYPMNRFFNQGQGAAAEIDWNTAKFLDKLDGTCCILYHDTFRNEWHVATRSVPEANVSLYDPSMTFRTLFEKALKDSYGMTFAELTACMEKDYTYCFELTTPYNRVVVKYDTCDLHLIMVRNRVTFCEIIPESIPGFPVKVVGSRSFTSKKDMAEWVLRCNPIEHEGIVVRDNNFNRIKVKNPDHATFTHIRGSLATSTRACLEIVLREKVDDVAAHMPPEIADNLFALNKSVRKLVTVYNSTYTRILEDMLIWKEIRPEVATWSDKKLFAILAQKTECKGWLAPFFALYDNKALGMMDFFKKNQNSNGEWNNSFLDSILKEIKNYHEPPGT